MSRKSPIPPPEPLPRLLIPYEEADQRIKEQLQKADILLNAHLSTEEDLQSYQDQYATWTEYNSEMLKRCFNSLAVQQEYDSYPDIAFGSFNPTLEEEKITYFNNVREKVRRLESVRRRLSLYEIAPSASTSSQDKDLIADTVERIDLIASRLHAIIRQLRHRHDNRSTLDVADEYDVQDLVHSILHLFFNDIRPEEWTPNHAGANSRMDFLLKREKVVVETKKTRQGLDARKLGDELAADIIRYQSHPDCSLLYCLVYDPDGRIVNPRGFESDLTGQKHGIRVVVSIVPKTH